MLKKEIVKLAQESRCELYYQDFEFEGKKRQIKRNHLFFIFFFPDNPKYIINFLYLLKKRKYAYIESIGFDNCKFTLLYASKKYLNMMGIDVNKWILKISGFFCFNNFNNGKKDKRIIAIYAILLFKYPLFGKNLR